MHGITTHSGFQSKFPALFAKLSIDRVSIYLNWIFHVVSITSTFSFRIIVLNAFCEHPVIIDSYSVQTLNVRICQILNQQNPQTSVSTRDLSGTIC